MARIVFSLLAVLCCVQMGWAATGWEGVQRTLGQPGVEQESGIRFTFPRADLNVMVQGIALEPPMDLTSWISFLPLDPAKKSPQSKCLLLGELVLTDQEVPSVTASLAQQGFKVTALESPFLDESPSIKCFYIEDHGYPGPLASRLKSILLKVGGSLETPTPLPTLTPNPVPSVTPSPTPANSVKFWAKVQKVMGEGRMDGKVQEYIFPLPQKADLEGVELPPFMGMASHIEFQKVEGLAIGQKGLLGMTLGSKVSKDVVAATGEFVLPQEKVESVMGLLTKNGIRVTALQGHLMGESPRFFFIHFWAIGDPEEVAKGLKEVLDEATEAETN